MYLWPTILAMHNQNITKTKSFAIDQELKGRELSSQDRIQGWWWLAIIKNNNLLLSEEEKKNKKTRWERGIIWDKCEAISPAIFYSWDSIMRQENHENMQ